MATAELIAERLAHPSQGSDLSSPLRPTGARACVVEFDPDGKRSRTSRSPVAIPTHSPSPRGFVYDGVRAGPAVRAGLSRRQTASRPLPMEEVALFIKDIDNSLVRRKPDPRGKSAWLRFVVSGAMILMVVLLSSGPRAWLRHSGYRQAEMERDYQQLLEFNQQLKVRQAMLSDLQRISVLAAEQGFVEPPTDQFEWQDRTINPDANSALAENNLGGAPAAGVQ